MTTSARDFLSAFHRGKGLLEIRILDTRGRIAYFENTAEAALHAAEKWRSVSEANIYFGVCPRKEDGRASLDDILCSFAIWVDIDVESDDDRKARIDSIKKFPLPPSAVVNSGNGFHVYWLLQKPTQNWTVFAKIIKAFETLLDADSTGDRTRVLRVPDTNNNKNPHSPRPVQIVEELTDLSRRYSLRDVALVQKLFEPEHKLIHKITTGDVRGFPSRSERDWNVMTTLVRIGLSEDAIRYIFDVHPIGDRARDDSKYFERTLKEARESRDPKDAPLNLVIKTPDAQPPKERGNGDSAILPNQDELDEEVLDEAEGNIARWMFAVGDDGFLYRIDGKDPRMVATFVFEPMRLLKGADDNQEDDVLLGDIKASGHEWHNVTFPRKAFARTDALHRELHIAAWQWLGTDKDTREYLPYLMDLLQEKGLPHTRYVPSLGRYNDVWVTSEGAITSGEIHTKLTSPKVLNTRFENETNYKYIFPTEEELQKLKDAVKQLLPQINTPQVIWPMIGWYFACAYKPVLRTRLGVRFPILNVWGTRGSGKTCTVTEVFLPMMGAADQPPAGHECDTTQFVLLALLGATTSIPIAFTEFRQSAMRTSSYRRFLHCLLQSYDAGRDSRGRPDQTTQQYPLTSPFSVDGEDMVSDAAARERVIAVNLEPETVLPGSAAYVSYQRLNGLGRDALRGLAGPYVQFVLEQDERELWQEACRLFDTAFRRPVPPRVRNNYTVVILGILSYLRFMGEELAEGEESTFIKSALEPSLMSLINPEGRTSLPVDEFIEDIVNAVGLQTAGAAFFYRYYEEENELRFQLTTALNWWYSKRRREGTDTLAKDAIKQQLKERQKEYVQAAKGVSVGGSTKWMHGVDLAKAVTAGLDIPETLPAETEYTISF